jgi:hypothetical protein
MLIQDYADSLVEACKLILLLFLDVDVSLLELEVLH